MYNVSHNTKIKNAYNQAWQNENRKLKLKMTLNNVELDLANVLDCITWEWDGCSNGYSVGNVLYSRVTFSLHKSVLVQELMDVTFTISIEIEVDGIKEWLDIPFGQYMVTNVEKTKLQSKVTCYDKFYNDLKFLFAPQKASRQYTTTELLYEICNTLGMRFDAIPTYQMANEKITVEDENGNTTTKTGTNFDGWTYHEILGLIAGVCGGNFFFGRNGNLSFQKGLQVSDVALTERQFTEPSMKINIYSKTGLRIKKRNDIADIVVGDMLAEGNPRLYIIENPFFTDETANELLSVLSDISYQPIATSVIGVMPLHLCPMDAVTINYENKDYVVPLMKLTYKFASGLSGTFESYVETSTEATKFSGGGLNGKIESIQGSVEQMELLVATTVVASNVNASNIESLNVKTEQLQANYGQINNLVSGNLTANNILTGSITSDRLNVADGFITNSMINSVDASKIRSGSIDTGSVTIKSDDGRLILADETIQISDANRVRVQIGKDARNDYNMTIWDADGNLMFDATGITEDAIQDAIIRDDMISDAANINAKKLDIASLFAKMNEDGSNTLKASKVWLDTEQQNLGVAFNEMNVKTNLLSETTNTLQTKLDVQQGQIESLVANTTIVQGEQSVTLKDAYSQISQDVDSITSTVNSIQKSGGGKNLLLNTQRPLLESSDTGGVTTSHVSDYVRINSTVPDANAYTLLTTTRQLIQGRIYTISFEFWNDCGQPIGFYWYPSEHYSKKDYIPSVNSTWQKIAFTYEHTGDNKEKGQHCLFGFYDIPANHNVAFRNIMLNEGVCASDWELSPEEVSANVTSEIQQTADSITSTVSANYSELNGKISSANSQIQQNANSIATKVDADGVKSTIQQSANEVVVAFNAYTPQNGSNGNGRITMNTYGIHTFASDGSYSTMGSGQMTHYIANEGWTYHSMMKQGWLGRINGTEWSRTIQLPSAFKGKVFSVIVTVTEVQAVNTHDVVKYFQVTVPQANVDYANAKFTIYGYAKPYYVVGQSLATAIIMDVSWTAIC